MSIKKIARNNWPIIILAFIVGFLVVLPTIASIYKIGFDNFRGIYPIFNKDEIHYLAMAREVSDGHASMGNVFIKEHKDMFGIQPSLTEGLFSGVSKLFHISIPALFAVNDFILPFIGVILLYLLILNITKSKYISCFFSFLFFILFLHTFGRPINPQFSFIFLVFGLIVIWKIISVKNQDKKILIYYNVLLAVIVGILIYIYPYCWTAIMVVYGLNVLIIIFNRRSILPVVNSLLTFFALIALFALPYILNLFKASSIPFYGETMLRFGMLSNHWPACYVNIALILFTAVILFMVRKKIADKNRIYFSCSLLLGAIILNWQNVITGKYLQFSSHYYQVTILFIFIVLAIIFNFLFSHLKENKYKIRLKNIFIYFSILILLIFIFNKQAGEIKRGFLFSVTEQEMKDIQGAGDLFDWFNDNTAPDSVVYALNNDYSSLLPIYTHNNLYSYSYAGYYLMPDDEIEDRWVRQNIFNNNIDADYIIKKSRAIWNNKFIDNYQNRKIRNKIISKLTGGNEEEAVMVPLFYVERVLDKYNKVRNEDLEKALKKFEIDYILLEANNDNKELKEEFEKFDFIKLLEVINNNYIYKILD